MAENTVKTPKAGSEEDLRELLERNLRLSEQIHEDNQKIRRYMTVRMVISIIWIVIVVAPIIFALIWLPPRLQEFINDYGDAVDGGQNAMNMLNRF